MTDKEVVVYSTTTCPYCDMVKNFLDEKGVEYTNYNVSENPEKAKEMIQKTGQRGVPVVDIEGQIVIGFDKGKLKELLEL